MKHIIYEKIKILVSTVAVFTVLTFILTACNTVPQDKTSTEEIKENKTESVAESNEYSGDEKIPDGEYELYVSLAGGTGKATIKSPAKTVVRDGKITVTIEWSSSNYDYMIVGDEKYLPTNETGNSVFEIPIESFDCEMTVTADTVAMSKPHEIEYTLKFSSSENGSESYSDEDDTIATEPEAENADVRIWTDNHTLTSKMERKYAEKFAVSFYDNKYEILTVNGTDFYLISKTDDDIPADLPECISVIKVPVKKAYVVSSASYNYLSCLDAISCTAYTSQKKGDVDNDELNEKIANGTIKYAGKYSAPDYELILSGGCDLVVENTMILHSADVLNQMKKLNINTIIDYSSKESNPLGRMEWIKFYGVLTDKEDEASAIFNEKEKGLSKQFIQTGKKIAYFYITNSGAVVIRKNDDYIAKLIQIAGGNYAFNGLSEYNGTGTMTIQKEAFYDVISDCDYMIYNTTISGSLSGLDELVSKFEVLKNTKAYRDNHIFCTTQDIYVKSMELPEIAEDINKVINDNSDTTYIYRLD